VLLVVLVLGGQGEIPTQNGAVNLSTALLDSCMVAPPNFDREKLDVYRLELKFLAWVTQFPAFLETNCTRQRNVDPYRGYAHQTRVRESALGVAEPFEDEDDDEHEHEMKILARKQNFKR